jgi:hypothetical protein
MNENINRILKMVEDGKIDAAKAAELIEALNEKEPATNTQTQTKEKMLKVRILSAKGETVNVNLPIKFVKSSIKAFGKIPINIHGETNHDIDMQAIADAIENGIDGRIVDINSKSGDKIEVVIE